VGIIKALQQAQAMEAVAKESKNIQGGNSDSLPEDNTTNAISSYGSCYHCGYKGHSANMYRFKTANCHVCQKVGCLARVCRSRQRTKSSKKHKSPIASKTVVLQLQYKEMVNDSDSDGGLFNTCQFKNLADKFIVSVIINGVDMEIDSGMQRSTVPWSLFQGQLAIVCYLRPTSVTL